MATTRGSLQVKDGKYYAVLSFKTDEIQANGKPKYKTKWFCTAKATTEAPLCARYEE